MTPIESPAAPRVRLEPPADFPHRHVGPDEAEIEAMLQELGLGSLDELMAKTLPAAIRLKRAARAARAARRGAGARRARAQGREEPAAALVHRHGLLRLRHAGGDPAQRAREPGLVHAVHAVPGRDRAGPARGAPQLPDDGRRPHRRCRSRTRRCSTRRRPPPRRWRCAAPCAKPRQATASSSPRTATRRRSRWCATRAEPLGIAGRTSGRIDDARLRGAAPVRRARPVPGDRRRAARPAPAQRARPRRGRARRGRDRPARAHAAHAARRARRRHRGRARRSASACRSATAGRTPRSSRCATSTSASCRAASSASRRTPRARPPTGSRCRRASSTSGATRPRATSAPRRCCSR